MLQVRVKALHNVTHIIGDREDTYNWFDPLRGVLKLTIRDLIQYEISFNPLARVAHIRKDGVWEVDHPIPRPSFQFGTVFIKFKPFRMPRKTVVRKPSYSGKFTLKLAFEALEEPRTEVTWSKLIWFKGHIP